MGVIHGRRHITLPGGPVVVRQGRGAVAPAGWWVVAGKTAVAAYCPKGAASLAASYINLVQPGTYDAAEGVAPTWDAGAGWKFNGSTQYLATGIVPSPTWTIIASVARGGTVQGYDIGCITGSDEFGVGICAGWAQHMWANGPYPAGFVIQGGETTPVVMALAHTKAYHDGILFGTIATPRSDPYTTDLSLGGYAGYRSDSYVRSVVIYSAALTDGEVATVSAAMAAL